MGHQFWILYINYQSSSNEALPRWLRAIEEDDQGIAVWQPKTRLPHEEKQQNQKGEKQNMEEDNSGEE